jgi:membrane-bound lytic murein transglycosylase A
MSTRIVLAAVLVCSLLPACRSKDYSRPLPPGQVALRKITDPARLPDFRPAFGDSAGLVESIAESRRYFGSPSSKKFFPYLDVTHDRALQTLEAFQRVLTTASSADAFHRQIVTEFDVYESVGCDNEGTVLFTGYCTPIYEASRKPTAVFRYPLYKLPSDLARDEVGRTVGRRMKSGMVVPYPTRSEIKRGNLLRGLELVWLKDRYEAYTVEVQGSAEFKMRDGSRLSVGYAGDNGYDYTSVGLALVEDGKLAKKDLSLVSIKRYFRENPDELDFYLFKNKRFIFFSEEKGGPYGCLGVKVTALRSLATDKKPDSPDIYPRGCLAYLRTELPSETAGGGIVKGPYSGFALDHDRGSAIRSAGRADVYMGIGPRAVLLAGHTMSEGRLYYIFVK